MRYAHHIFRKSDHNWRESLMLAWQIHYLRKAMLHGPVMFYYKKRDGSHRCAFGQMLEDGKKSIKIKREPRFDTVTYYDLERKQWRCFKVENFIAICKKWKFN